MKLLSWGEGLSMWLSILSILRWVLILAWRDQSFNQRFLQNELKLWVKHTHWVHGRPVSVSHFSAYSEPDPQPNQLCLSKGSWNHLTVPCRSFSCNKRQQMISLTLKPWNSSSLTLMQLLKANGAQKRRSFHRMETRRRNRQDDQKHLITTLGSAENVLWGGTVHDWKKWTFLNKSSIFHVNTVKRK